MYKLLVFDWDGTLIDSAARIVSSMQQAAAEVGLPHLDDAPIRNIIGLGLPEALQQLYPGIDDPAISAMRERYSYFYLEGDSTPTALFPGVSAGLARLRDAGYSLAVATGKSRRGLDRVFTETDTGHFFDFSRCADETKSKPHPLMLKEILAQSNLAAENALMIGDTEYDLEMASRAGMPSLGVSYGAHEPGRLLRHNPRGILQAFSDLEAWLKSQQSGHRNLRNEELV